MKAKIATYKIVRAHIRDSEPAVVIKSGLTLAEAQEHCKSPETSWRTCTSADSKAYTKKHGAWFDGYEMERAQ